MLLNTTFSDVDRFCEAMQTWDAEIYPLAKEQALRPAVTVVQRGERDYEYMFCEFSLSLELHGDPPKNLITFNVLEPMNERYWWRGHDLSSHQVFVFKIGAELDSVTPRNFGVHTLSISKPSLEQIAAESELDLPQMRQLGETFWVPPELLFGVRATLRLMRDCSYLFSKHLVHRCVREVLPYWVQQRGLRSKPQASARDLAVRRALDLIESVDLAEITTRRLLLECGVSERSLQYGFRERFGISPAAFLKARRLAKVRATLRRADPLAANIGETAADAGFWHLGQFATDYRRAFGELPSETLQYSYR